MTPNALAKRLEGVRSPADNEALLAELRRLGERQPALLLELARISDQETRDYLVRYSAHLGALQGDILEQAARRDPDSDIKMDALQLLSQRDPGRAARMLPAIRRRLQSSDFFEPVAAMWTVLRLRDLESLPILAAVEARWGNDDGRGRIARIVAAALNGDYRWISDRLLGHELHHETAWLARAARLTADQQLLSVVRRCSVELPDEECRAACREETRAADTTGAMH